MHKDCISINAVKERVRKECPYRESPVAERGLARNFLKMAPERRIEVLWLRFDGRARYSAGDLMES